MNLGPIDDPIERVCEETKSQALLRQAQEIERLKKLAMNQEQIDAVMEFLWFLSMEVAMLVEDDHSRREIMRKWSAIRSAFPSLQDKKEG